MIDTPTEAEVQCSLMAGLILSPLGQMVPVPASVQAALARLGEPIIETEMVQVGLFECDWRLLLFNVERLQQIADSPDTEPLDRVDAKMTIKALRRVMRAHPGLEFKAGMTLGEMLNGRH